MSVYVDALNQAKKESVQIAAEIQRLQSRQSTLQSLIRSLQMAVNHLSPARANAVSALTSDDEEENDFEEEDDLDEEIDDSEDDDEEDGDVAELQHEARLPLWKTIWRLMRTRSHFTPSQAGDAVESFTQTSLQPNRPQKIRNALTRHPETFRRNADGTYTVIGGEA